ncbi:MAG: helix-turn-helix domain-containing protein [Thermomicrobiales bacterium]
MTDHGAELSTFTFDSAIYADGEGLERWRDQVGATHDIAVDSDAPFHVQAAAFRRGTFVLSCGQITPQAFIRTRQRIRRDPVDDYALFTIRDGTRLAVLEGAEILLDPGWLQVCDLAQPETSVSSGGRSTTFYLPRPLIDSLIPGMSRYHGTILRNERARLLARHLLMASQYLGSLEPAAVEAFTDLTTTFALDLLLSAFNPAGLYRKEVAVDREAIVAFIRDHLSDSDLSLDAILMRFPMSRSTLYRMFEGDGGIEHFIRNERLRTIRLVLLQSQDDRSLHRIALDHGFRSGFALTRAFRESFGHPPSVIRGRSPYDAADRDHAGLDGLTMREVIQRSAIQRPLSVQP